jgi:hypothetical protein
MLTQEQFNKLRQQGLSVNQIVKFEKEQNPEEAKSWYQRDRERQSGFIRGVGKEIVNFATGASSLGERGIKALGRAVTPKQFEENLGFEKTEQTSAERLIPEEARTPEGTAEKAGFYGTQIAEYLIPQTKITKGASLGQKAIQLGGRALASGGIASAQEGEIGKETAIAGGTELALPVVGKALKPVASVFGRLLKGLGSGLSGVGTDVLETIYRNPEEATKVSKQIIESGQETVLRNNAQTILDGVSKIRQQARNAYGEGLDKLSSSDISRSKFRSSIQEVLDDAGSVVKDGVRKLRNVEFDNTNMIKKTSNLIDDLSKTKLDGRSLRNLANKIDSAKFKTTGNDAERLSFNALMNKLQNGLKEAIRNSTDKLDDINKEFSKDMSLAEGIESIFGKVNFKNTTELNKIARKLETLFNQKGLDPETLNSFLNKLGIDEQAFRTSEAVRGIVTKKTGANTKGLSIAEILQQVTSSVITPNSVKNISIATGLSQNILETIIKNTSPVGRAAIIKSLIESNK